LHAERGPAPAVSSTQRGLGGFAQLAVAQCGTVSHLRATQSWVAKRALARLRRAWYTACADGDSSHSGPAPNAQRSTTVEHTAEQTVVVDADVAADNAKQNSVVKTAYKARYAERAVANGHARKAAQRSAWDWLARTIAGECLRDGDKLDVPAFLALLDANGVDHSRWTNRNKGWEGRLRMTGRLALQRVVAEAGVLHTADGDELVADEEWVAKYSN